MSQYERKILDKDKKQQNSRITYLLTCIVHAYVSYPELSFTQKFVPEQSCNEKKKSIPFA